MDAEWGQPGGGGGELWNLERKRQRKIQKNPEKQYTEQQLNLTSPTPTPLFSQQLVSLFCHPLLNGLFLFSLFYTQ